MSFKCTISTLRRIAQVAFGTVIFGAVVHGQTTHERIDPQMVSYLETRVRSKPDDASSWRLLGRAYHDNGQTESALDALARSIELDPLSAAAHFNMATVYQGSGSQDEATQAFQRVVELAPDSEYAQQAREVLSTLPSALQESEIVQTGYEIKRFDGSNLLRERRMDLFNDGVSDDWPPILASLELGALYNTNVALTPGSREFAAVRAESAQIVASPKLEYWLYEGELWRAGPTFSGDFTVNEADFESLNLQSYRPGAFLERSLFLDGAVVIPRLQYDYTLDQFGGVTFDDRHALTASTTTLWDAGGSTVAYLTTNLTDFANDGATPALTSRDGWTYGLGLSHTHAVKSRFLSAVSIGADVEFADVDGSTFAYNGVSTFLAGEVPLTKRLSLILEGGWGYRDYPQATVTPDRNENIWRGGTRLLFRINDYWSVAAIFKYDRFDSNNRLFQSERVLTGVVTAFVF